MPFFTIQKRGGAFKNNTSGTIGGIFSSWASFETLGPYFPPSMDSQFEKTLNAKKKVINF